MERGLKEKKERLRLLETQIEFLSNLNDSIFFPKEENNNWKSIQKMVKERDLLKKEIGNFKI